MRSNKVGSVREISSIRTRVPSGNGVGGSKTMAPFSTRPSKVMIPPPQKMYTYSKRGCRLSTTAADAPPNGSPASRHPGEHLGSRGAPVLHTRDEALMVMSVPTSRGGLGKSSGRSCYRRLDALVYYEDEFRNGRFLPPQTSSLSGAGIARGQREGGGGPPEGRRRQARPGPGRGAEAAYQGDAADGSSWWPPRLRPRRATARTTSSARLRRSAGRAAGLPRLPIRP